jgi:hypothetical protein
MALTDRAAGTCTSLTLVKRTRTFGARSGSRSRISLTLVKRSRALPD